MYNMFGQLLESSSSVKVFVTAISSTVANINKTSINVMEIATFI